MAIGIDEIDDFDDFDDFEDDNTIPQNIETSQEDDNEESSLSNDDSSIIEHLLRSKGISDSSKIKFESDEDGEIQEVDWNSLSAEDKLNILSSDTTEAIEDNSDQLDDSEIELINTIRSSKMSPTEYITYMQQQGINNYLSNQQVQNYVVDDISDDELFITDTISKLGEDNVTDEELKDMLEQAKSNPTLYQKQIQALRNEYKGLEDNNIMQEQEYQRQAQIEQYNQFAENIEKEIRAFTDFGGYELNMDESEMEELYDFISGFDDAGVSIFGKALNDPALLVRMAWFALNGEQAMQDINDYWTNEIKQVRKSSYEKGIQDAKKPSNLTIRSSSRNKSNYIDDDFID